MTEFRNLPQQFSAGADDEFLVVGASGPHRITARALHYDNLALLKFKYPADQEYGIAAANTWVQLPLNDLNSSGVDQWVTLNPDGSFVLSPGLYNLAANVGIVDSSYQRLGLFNGATMLELVAEFASFTTDPSGANSTNLSLRHRFALATPETLSLQLAVSATRLNALHVADSFLTGYQASLVTCLIEKLG